MQYATSGPRFGAGFGVRQDKTHTRKPEGLKARSPGDETRNSKKPPHASETKHLKLCPKPRGSPPPPQQFQTLRDPETLLRPRTRSKKTGKHARTKGHDLHQPQPQLRLAMTYTPEAPPFQSSAAYLEPCRFQAFDVRLFLRGFGGRLPQSKPL